MCPDDGTQSGKILFLKTQLSTILSLIYESRHASWLQILPIDSYGTLQHQTNVSRIASELSNDGKVCPLQLTLLNKGRPDSPLVYNPKHITAISTGGLKGLVLHVVALFLVLFPFNHHIILLITDFIWNYCVINWMSSTCQEN